MIEAVVGVVGEFLLQAIGEVLLNLGFHAMSEPFRKPPNPWLAAFGYALLGALAGAGSLLVLRGNLVPEPWRVVNLILTPVAVGGLMVLMGAWRVRRGEPLLRIDQFLYGYLFALALSIVRFFFAG